MYLIAVPKGDINMKGHSSANMSPRQTMALFLLTQPQAGDDLLPNHTYYEGDQETGGDESLPLSDSFSWPHSCTLPSPSSLQPVSTVTPVG